jgi:AcrR family transcriptional regulator
VYGERGWSGLTMEDVARQARVGKAALYLRWPTKEDVLAAALIDACPHFDPEDAERAPRELLLVIGSQMREQYGNRFGRALLRLALDRAQSPEVFARVSRRFYRELEFGVDALDAAAREGHLARGVDSVNLIEALGGAILMRTLFTTGWDNARAEPISDEFVGRIVNLIAPVSGTGRAD